MANNRSTNDLKKLALQHAGELQNGSSPFDSVALIYINNLHRDLLAGGNEFGIDTAEPWVWAQAKRPIVLTLLPAYETGTVTVTQGSMAATFSLPPSNSIQGWFLKIENESDYIRILSHQAGSANFVLDQGYTQDSGSFNFSVCCLEYDLIDDTVLVDSTNSLLDFSDSGGVVTATLTQGVYAPNDYIAMVAAAMQAVGNGTYVGSFDTQTRTFTLTHGGVSFSLLFVSGPNAEKSPYKELGADLLDTNLAPSFTGAYPLNAIQRLIGPMTVYKSQDWGWLAPQDSGKIYGIDQNTLQSKYPMTQLSVGIPTRFAEVAYSSAGIMRVKFDRYPCSATRVEVPYIPLCVDLQDNQISVPLVPISYRDYLVFSTTYYLMADKSDDRAAAFGSLAEKKLQALVNANRKKNVLTGLNYGRLIPRGSNQRRYRVHESED